jgi:hypothetical protein
MLISIRFSTIQLKDTATERNIAIQVDSLEERQYVAHQNPLQRTVVCAVTMVCALTDSTLDGLICMIVHDVILLFLISKLVCPRFQNSIQEKSVNIAFYQQM